jgi:DNA-binding transcriptional ArsR family regulator
LSEDETANILKGKALEIYRFLLKTKKPIGIRELQRALDLSSPSIAQYHLTRLERAGLVKKEMGSYVVNRILLDSCIKINRFIIPKYVFYSVFAAIVLIIEVTVFMPYVLTREYLFSTFATVIFLLIFCNETVKVWRKGSL